MLNPLIPIAAAAAGSVALQAVEKISESLSFADVFSGGQNLSSSAAEKADEKNNSPSLLDAGNAAGVSTTELAAGAQSSLEQFRENLTRYLAAAGIDLSAPILLESDGFGGVQLAGDHPQRREIEQLFATNPELNQAFNKLSAQFGVLQAAKEQEAFTQLYKLDPRLAAQQYAHLFEDDKSQNFSLRILGDQAEVLSQ